jgi:Arc/MetJ family transcription regulator
MAKTPIDLDEALLAAAAVELGTETKKDTVNEALRFVAERRARGRAAVTGAGRGLGWGEDIGDPEVMKGARR